MTAAVTAVSPRGSRPPDELTPAICETHISIVFLVGDRAVKVKKPVLLPFLDWRRREARAAACQREVDLNRRLAPDVYLGVAAVVGDNGAPYEHLVVMRRMPEARRLSRLVRDGADVRPALDELAALMARFHAAATRSPAITAAAGRDGVRRNWEDNISTLRPFAGEDIEEDALNRVDSLAHAYLAGRGPLFAERGAAGLAVDGHGDLMADDIYVLDDGPRVLDCLEFDDRLRAVDVLDDVAFLAMDLERLGRADLASTLLDAYQHQSGERHPPSLVHHYVAYRAGVRAKVACLRARQEDRPAPADARQLLDLALGHLEEGRVRLVLVGGLPGAGKSTLAAGIADRLGWKVVRSDVVRKQLARVDPSTPMPAAYREGIYSPAHTRAVYDELLGRARRLLERGESVILDASWTDAAHRAAAEHLAAALSTEFVALRCDTSPAVAAARLVKRPHIDPSDAEAAIASAMAGDASPWPEAITLDTTVSAGDVQTAALRALGLELPDGSGASPRSAGPAIMA